MGLGDKLMAIGDAWDQHQSDPHGRRVMIGNGLRLDLKDSDLAWGLDHFLATPETFDPDQQTWVVSYPGCRPYIDYDAMGLALVARGTPSAKRRKYVSMLGRYIFRTDYRAKPAPMRLRPEEEALAATWRASGPFVLLEPFIKEGAPPSKQWPVDRFAETAQLLASDIPVYQIAAPGRPALPDIPQIVTGTFREALAVLSAADLYVGPEGGLHHASAAMQTDAVVVFGGFVSPLTTGYDFHINLTGGAEGGCGTRFDLCLHCKKALEAITPSDVAAAARGRLGSR
jgi:hypothetical protein